MQLREVEERIIQQACAKLKDTDVFDRILNADYSKSYPKANKNDYDKLQAYTIEGLLYAVMMPLGKLYFSNKMIHEVYAPDAFDKFVDFARAHLKELNFSGNYSAEIRI